MMTTWNGIHTFNEYASFVQALRLDLDVWFVGSCSLIRFTGLPSCLVCFVTSHQRSSTKALKKKIEAK